MRCTPGCECKRDLGNLGDGGDIADRSLRGLLVAHGLVGFGGVPLWVPSWLWLFRWRTK